MPKNKRKQNRIRKSATTLTSTIITMLLVIGIFTGAWLYTLSNIHSTDAVIEVSSYTINGTNKINESLSDFSKNIFTIRDNFKDISEADNTYQAVLNGMKGLGNTLKLPITFLDNILTFFQGVKMMLEGFIPGWIFPIAYIGIIAFMVFLILKVLKGEPNM